ncbi:tail fiber domain-containing protein [Halovivax cerinus]|uniref:Tail fiber domain-containing protein n=1 Tax=Halovivax cerinus TaxID=1487865 RepID=A0ABD5NPV8_9EURY|nr:tail fiber domain-containing protein [Halovivax cerinus]
MNGSGVTGAETFHVKATGGVRFITGGGTTYISGGSTGWSTTSTRSAKTNVEPVEPSAVLEGVESMPVATWEYTGDDGDGAGTTHIGPMAEDFHEAFDVGDSDRHINSINADGVALAAIKGLAERLDEREERLDDQRGRLDELEAENEALRERLDALEARRLAADGGDADSGIDGGDTDSGIDEVDDPGTEGDDGAAAGVSKTVAGSESAGGEVR